jgi:hypothetical protein
VLSTLVDEHTSEGVLIAMPGGETTWRFRDPAPLMAAGIG